MLKSLYADLELALGDLKRRPFLKILFVVDRFEVWGGLETYLVTLIKYLAERGNSVFIDCGKIDELFLKEFEAHDRIQVLINKTDEEISRLAKDNKVDIIQGQTYGSANRTFKVYKQTKIPFIITCHSPIVNNCGLTNMIVASATKIIAVSKEIYSSLVCSYPMWKSKVIIVQNPVITERLPSNKFIDDNSLSLMFLGRLDRDRKKGVELLIEAYKSSNYTSLIICGDGNSKEELQKKYSSDGSIIFLGAVAKPFDLILKSHVIVATGRGAREALAAGKPCIVLSSWGYDGIITPSQVDLLETANFSGRARTLSFSKDIILRDLKILEDKVLQKRLGAFGQKLVFERYSIELIGEKILMVYNQAVKGQEPVVSVILPVYNHSDLLEASVNSILKQTLEDFELIVINDGSTDKFDEKIRQFSDKRIKVLTNETNMKLPYTLNKGLLEAKGRYVTWTSADNLLLPEFLEELVTVLEDNPEYGSVYSDYYQINHKGNLIRKMSKGIYTLDAQTNFGPAFLYRREVVESAGFFDEELFGIEDRDYSIRMAVEAPVLWLRKVLYHYRIHDNSLTGKFVKKEISFAQTFKNFRQKWGSCLDFAEKEANLFDKSPLDENLKKELLFWAKKDYTYDSFGNERMDKGLLFTGSTEKDIYRTMLQFDLSSISRNSYLLKAELEIFIVLNENLGTQHLSIFPTYQQKNQLPQESVIDIKKDPFSWAKIDITDMVRWWINNEKEEITLSINSHEKGIVGIASNRYQINSLRPRLRVLTSGYVRGKEVTPR